MRFLCKTEFFHSGVRLYTVGTVYSDITHELALELIALDKKKPLGALEYFTPVDEDAINFVKDRKEKESAPSGGGSNGITPAARPPSKTELVAEAKNIGIKGADRMSVEELKQAIAAVQAGGVTQLAETPPPQE